MRILVSLILLFLVNSAVAQPHTAKEVLEKHHKTTTALLDVKAKATLGLNLQVGFLPYSENLHGHYYYLKPNQHRLQFDNAPSYLDQVPNMFKWDLPDDERYATKLKPPSGSSSQPYYQILFLPKDPDSSTLSIVASFSADDWRMVRHETSYRDGGLVSLEFDYLSNSKLPILDRIAAKVSFPSYSAKGNANIRFSDQQSNKGLGKEGFDT